MNNNKKMQLYERNFCLFPCFPQKMWQNIAACAAICCMSLIIRRFMAAMFVENCALTVPLLCRWAEAQVVASCIAYLIALPTELLEGEPKVGEIRQVAGSQVLGEFLLDG